MDSPQMIEGKIRRLLIHITLYLIEVIENLNKEASFKLQGVGNFD